MQHTWEIGEINKKVSLKHSKEETDWRMALKLVLKNI